MGVLDAEEDDALWSIILKLVLAAALTIFAPYMAYLGITGFLNAWASNSWPQAQATITRYYTTVSNGRGGTKHTPQVEYQFTVNGQSYTGNNLTYGGAPPSMFKADIDAEYGSKYAPGTKHPVYYDPAAPKESVIERGFGWGVFLMLIVGPLLVVAGPVGLWKQYQSLQNNLAKGRSQKKSSKSKSKSPTRTSRRRRRESEDEE